LADAKRKFRIEIVDQRTVQAIFKSPQLDVETTGIPTQGLVHSEKGLPLDVMNPMTAASVIQAWQNAQPSNERFHFPNAKLPFEELVRLYQWCKNDRPIQLYLLVGMSGEITVCPYFSGVEAVEWTPSDGE
jgi:hypothetical protein